LIVTAVPFLVAGAVIDFLAPATQLDIPDLQQIIWITAGVLLAVYAVVVISQFPTYPIATKFLLTFLLVALIPLGLLLATTSIINHPALTQIGNERLMTAAVQTANSVDNYISSNANATRSEAQLPILASYLALPVGERVNSPAETVVLNTLRALSGKNEPIITSYALLDATGRIVLDTQPQNIGRDESARSHFRVPVADRLLFYVSPVEFESETGLPSLYFSSPIWDSSGELLGVLRARHNPAVLQQIIQQSALLGGVESHAILLDDNLMYLGHSERPSAVHTLIAAQENPPIQQLQSLRRLPPPPSQPTVQFAPELAAILQRDSSRRTFGADGLSADGDAAQTVAVRLISIPTWQVVVYQPRAVFTAATTTQTEVALLLTSVIAIAVALGAFAVSQRLSAPIQRLTTGARQVAAGDLTARMPSESEDEIGELARAFNAMTEELSQTLTGLEQRVAERTRALELTTEVSRQLSTILTQDKLVTAVVEEIKSKFNYYHVHIYLLDKDNQTLRMVGGTGEAGRAMLAANHSLPLGKGVVGRAAANENTELVADTSRDINWIPNPLLPETKAELAAPIILGDKLLGVIDVQQNSVNGLGDNDANLMQAIALQVAIGLQNAQAFAQAQRQADRQTLLNSINQQIQSSATMEKALQIAAREVGRALGGKQTIIKLRHEEPIPAEANPADQGQFAPPSLESRSDD
jgi:GAF domain-containing protein/HAMP domain-containing protein